MVEPMLYGAAAVCYTRAMDDSLVAARRRKHDLAVDIVVSAAMGESNQDVAARMGISRQRVWQILKEVPGAHDAVVNVRRGIADGKAAEEQRRRAKRTRSKDAPPGQAWCSAHQAYLPQTRFAGRRSGYCITCHNGYVRARNASAFVEVVDRAVVWERDGGVCGICGSAADPDRWDIDHIVPIKHGGVHSYANVQVAHPICNYKKGSKL